MKRLISKKLKKTIRGQRVVAAMHYLRSGNSLDAYTNLSYSQEGEDMLLRNLMNYPQNGFYVDIGAHHPRRLSNTYHFYQKGWKGILIDADPNIIEALRSDRSRDIVVSSGVGREGSLKFYMYDEPAVNTFDKKIVEQRIKDGFPHTVVETRSVKLQSLERILDKHLKKGQKIDFMDIDVEGHDFEVVKSNNWAKYRPQFLLVESIGASFGDIQNEDMIKFLLRQGYDVVAKLRNTVILKDIKK